MALQDVENEETVGTQN